MQYMNWEKARMFESITENWRYRAMRMNSDAFGCSRPPYAYEDIGERCGVTGPHEIVHIIKCTNAKGFWVMVGFDPAYPRKNSKMLDQGQDRI